ncbi:hypothetical protein HK097_007042, partial [Rhizophlyctis rosea]
MSTISSLLAASSDGSYRSSPTTSAAPSRAASSTRSSKSPSRKVKLPVKNHGSLPKSSKLQSHKASALQQRVEQLKRCVNDERSPQTRKRSVSGALGIRSRESLGAPQHPSPRPKTYTEPPERLATSAAHSEEFHIEDHIPALINRLSAARIRVAEGTRGRSLSPSRRRWPKPESYGDLAEFLQDRDPSPTHSLKDEPVPDLDNLLHLSRGSEKPALRISSNYGKPTTYRRSTPGISSSQSHSIHRPARTAAHHRSSSQTPSNQSLHLHHSRPPTLSPHGLHLLRTHIQDLTHTTTTQHRKLSILQSLLTTSQSHSQTLERDLSTLRTTTSQKLASLESQIRSLKLSHASQIQSITKEAADQKRELELELYKERLEKKKVIETLQREVGIERERREKVAEVLRRKTEEVVGLEREVVDRDERRRAVERLYVAAGDRIEGTKRRIGELRGKLEREGL